MRKTIFVGFFVFLGFAACDLLNEKEQTTNPPTPETNDVKTNPPSSGAVEAGKNNTGTQSGTPSSPEGLPGADSAAIIEFFTKTSPYQNWTRFPADQIPVGLKTDYLREGSIRFFNGTVARVYYNDIGTKALQAGQKAMPPGTLIVAERWIQKENGTIGPEDSPDNFVVQYKIKDFDPENGDWYYLVVQNAKAKVEGKVAACQNCHAVAKNNDFRFLGSDSISSIPTKIPNLSDKGNNFLSMLTKEFHYTQYDLIPDDAISKVVPRSDDLEEGIEWFNGKLHARLFANPLALATLEAKGTSYPDGALIVAEQFQKEKDGSAKKTPFAIVAQIKVEGADPKNGDWVWLSYNLSEKKILTFGKEATFCIDCHLEVKDNDFVWSNSGKLPGKKEE